MVFQPPEPAQATPAADPTPEPPAAAPRPRPPAETAPAGAGTGTRDTGPDRQQAGPADGDPVAEVPPGRSRRAPAAPTTPRKKTTTPTTMATPTEATPVKKAASVKRATRATKVTSAGTEAPGEPEAPARSLRVTRTTKAAPARKTAATKKTPAAPPVSAAPASQVTPESGRTSGEGWRAVGARVLEHPGFAPELLALAAVDTLGPRAGEWVRRTRGAYPGADADGLARLVTRRFVRLAGTGGALAAGAGLLAPVAELTAVLWTQANLVLHLAAVHGRDPGHPDRVAELLVLTQVHPDVATARAALDAVRSAGAPAEGPWPRVAEAAWRLATPLAAQASGRLGLRLVSRLLPGAALLTAAAGDAAATERLAARAIGRYRPGRARQSQPNQDFGSSA
ncbi:hypothetical protein [Micromonospora sp. NPDC005806]|uniref:hypothetical protein n=1 Tax=Micromonospora sp. NPDC005806 TaxID=3364234 RepID=UPI00367C6A79